MFDAQSYVDCPFCAVASEVFEQAAAFVFRFSIHSANQRSCAERLAKPHAGRRPFHWLPGGFVEIQFNPGGVDTQIQNVSGKTIVGLVFNAALTDAAEHLEVVSLEF